MDVACGGIDNLVRHHDYTLAVAEAVSGKQFAKYWLHGGHLYVDGKKMSKSLGNVVYPKDILEKSYEYQDLRFFLIYGCYRKKMNFTWQRIAKAKKKLSSFKKDLKKLEETESGNSTTKAKTLAHSTLVSFAQNMDRDLDVKSAFESIFETINMLARLSKKGKLGAEDAKAAVTDLRLVDRVLQVFF